VLCTDPVFGDCCSDFFSQCEGIENTTGRPTVSGVITYPNYGTTGNNDVPSVAPPGVIAGSVIAAVAAAAIIIIVVFIVLWRWKVEKMKKAKLSNIRKELETKEQTSI